MGGIAIVQVEGVLGIDGLEIGLSQHLSVHKEGGHGGADRTGATHSNG